MVVRTNIWLAKFTYQDKQDNSDVDQDGKDGHPLRENSDKTVQNNQFGCNENLDGHLVSQFGWDPTNGQG